MSGLLKKIIAIALGIGLIAFTVIYLIHVSNRINFDPETVGATAGNLYNDGLFCEEGGKVYFSNSYNEGCLYVMNPDQTEMKKIYNLHASFINAAGDYVFFFGKIIPQSQGLGTVVSKPGMYMIKKNGKQFQALTKDKSQCMLLIGNYVYYQHYTQKEGADFERINLKTKESEPCLDFFITPASYYQGKIYYNGQYTDHHLYTYDINTGAVQDIWAGDIWNPICTGDYVYYMDVRNNYRLCRYSISANQIEVLTEDRVEFFNVYENIIFYQKGSTTSPELKRMNINGSSVETIAQGVFNSINVTSQYTYFKEFGHDTITYYTPTFGSVDVREFTAARDAALENLK
ncbi:MAG: DUF5050 domain-containing protein [Lachnospiraceae bacterium]|nr:DUF5050 domain-containing protein [Lachnospiraceae bacterium]